MFREWELMELAVENVQWRDAGIIGVKLSSFTTKT
jgi:hypothetical protein